MPFNGSGVFQRVRNWVADAAAGIKIRADYHDSEDDGFATGLSNCITKDGQTVITQNIPFNNKRITGLADPVNPQDAATKASVTTLTADKLPLIGGTVTGDIVIKEAQPRLVLNTEGAAGVVGANLIRGQVNDKERWTIYLGYGGTESGGNLGSDFYLNRSGDDGVSLGNVLTFNRATGLGILSGDPTAAMGIVTKQYSDTSVATRVNRGGDTMTGLLISKSGALAIGQAAGLGTFEARGAQASGAAGMSFHLENVFAANFGMKGDGNFYMGGWSHGTSEYKFWTTRELPTPITGLRMQMAGDVTFTAPGPGAAMYEPFAGAVMTGWQYALAGGSTQVPTAFRMRYLQYQTPAGWFTAGLVA